MRLVKFIPMISFFVLTGCCSSGCFIVSGKAFDELAYPKPYLQKWAKNGVSSVQRREDSVACGSVRDIAAPESACWATSKCPPEGDRAPNFGSMKIKSAQKKGESEAATILRLSNEWKQCMLNSGYIYSGK